MNQMASTSTALRRPSTSGASFEKVNVPCKFYPACHFGDNCKFLHEMSSEATTSNNINNNIAQSILLSTSSNNLNPQAPVFVPTFYKQDFNPNCPPKSYAAVVNADRDPNENVADTIYSIEDPSTLICPFLIKSGFCRYATCSYVHGELCELCGNFCLDPLDGVQRKKHERECIAVHEKEMELAFSIQRSKEKTCGICFDIVWEKDGREQRFGILPNCNHCFCLECIRTWRQAKQFDNKIIRSCPECRVCSDFVCPSSFWVDSAEEKEKLISKYKNALSEKDCKYFKKGSGTCPFGNRCFYKHCLMDGKRVDVGEPTRTRALNSLGHLETLPSLLFLNFIEERMIFEGYSSDSSESGISDLLEFY